MLEQFIFTELRAPRVPLTLLLLHLANRSHRSSAVNCLKRPCCSSLDKIRVLWTKLFIKYKFMTPQVTFEAES